MSRLDTLIDDLAEQAIPVRPHTTRIGRLLLGAVAVMTIAATYLLLGFRGDVVRFAPSPEVSLAAGLMLLVAVAAGSTAVRMARPHVGAPSSGAPWALAALLLLPAIVLIGIAAGGTPPSALSPARGLVCLAIGLVAATATIAFLYLWLRRGAPVRPEKAAWLAGMAGGAVGALSVTLECPAEGLAHLGIWHVAVVPAAGLGARLLLPRLLRW